MKDKYKQYGKPWWKDRSREYVKKEATDIMRTFKKMGWIPPSEQKEKDEKNLLGLGR